jgi:hypothetical protein
LGQFRRQLSVLLVVACLCSGLFAEQSATTLPMEVRRNLPFVQVKVNGKGPFTFGIDTGTGGEALVTPDLIRQLGLPVKGEVEVGDPSGKNPRRVRTVSVASIELGDVEFKELTGVEFQPSRMSGNCDGILGFTLFRDYLFTLDYRSQQVRLARGALAADGNSEVVPFRAPNNVPTIELEVGGQTIDAHIDSRGGGLSLPAKFALGLKFASEPIVIGRGRTVSNEFEIKGAQLASDIHVGGYTFTQPCVEINPVFPVGNFGSAVLVNFAVTFDQKNQLVRLVSKERSIVIAPPQRRAPAPRAEQPK